MAGNRFSGNSTQFFIDECRGQARQALDPDYTLFMEALAERIEHMRILAYMANGSIDRLMLYVDHAYRKDSHIIDAQDLQRKLKEAARS